MKVVLLRIYLYKVLLRPYISYITIFLVGQLFLDWFYMYQSNAANSRFSRGIVTPSISGT